ncbi:MAG: histidine phosphatase family protein [Chloroflexota bacterium]
MRLYLIRHAESLNNAIYSEAGEGKDRQPDPEITEIGHQQAALLAAYLANPTTEPRQSPFSPKKDYGFGLTHLYCSLMTRSILTAEYIAEACGIPYTALPNLFEKGGIYNLEENGDKIGLPGPNRSYFTERFPTLILPEDLGDEGWYNRPFEMEEAFFERVKGIIPDIKARHLDTDDCVGLVVHGDLIDQFINELMQAPRHSANYKGSWQANWATHNTSVTRIDFDKATHIVVYINRIDHLPTEFITF